MAETPKRIGKYEVRSSLGAGALATVYQAYDPVIERALAIKVLDKRRLEQHEASVVLARFNIEARAAGRLHHPNIVTVFDCGEDGDLAFLVMECVFGQPLTAFLRAEDFRAEPDKVCEIILQVLAALAYSHAQGVIHRDIKPSNIMVSREGVIKITDFGVARLESSQLTQVGDVIGTPAYMAPEQFAGERADARTDLYGVAVIFYELLTRRLPFDGPNNAVIMQRVFTTRAVPPSEVNPLISAVLDPVVLRGLAKEPAERFQSAHEFERAVREAMAAGLLPPAPAGAPAGPRIASGVLKAVREGPTVARGASTPRDDKTLVEVHGTPATARQATNEAGAAKGAPAPRSRARLLFVDDETRILTALQALFRGNYEVVVCDDPRRAVELIKSTHFHVLVSDQRMPGMLGVELLRMAREISPRTVRILLTGYSDLASIVGSINEGEVWRFVNKPWDAQVIQETIAEAVSLAAALPDVPAWRLPPAPRFEEAVLALDPQGGLWQALHDALGREHAVVRARNVEEAVTALREREVAVLVADLDSDRPSVRTLLHLVKREFPQILALGVTDAMDSSMLIEFINQTQIHRFLNKPVAAQRLEDQVRSALNRYRTLRATPALAQVQQRVQTPKEQPPAAKGLLARLKRIRSHFGFGS
ncbi:MAG: protein kinase domain-containing protein [Betaproteobacteria bacterium]